MLILNTSFYRTQRLSTIHSHVYLRVLFPPGPISSIINEKSWEHTPSKIHSVKRWSTTNQITKIFLHWWTLKPFNIFHVLSWAFPCWVNKAPRLSIRRVIWISASDTVFFKLNQYSQILRRQCYLLLSGVVWSCSSMVNPHVLLANISRNDISWSRTGHKLFFTFPPYFCIDSSIQF